MSKGFDCISSLSVDHFTYIQRQHGFKFYISRIFDSIGIVDQTGIDNMKAADIAGLKTMAFIYPKVDFKDDMISASLQVEAAIQAIRDANIDNFLQNSPIIWISILRGKSKWDYNNFENNQKYIKRIAETIKAHDITPGIYTFRSNWEPIVGNWIDHNIDLLWWAQNTEHPKALKEFRPFGGWQKPFLHHYGYDSCIDVKDEDGNIFDCVEIDQSRYYEEADNESPKTELGKIELVFDEEINKLCFGKNLVYKFSYFHFVKQDIIGSSKNVVRKYYHTASGKSMAVKLLCLHYQKDPAKEHLALQKAVMEAKILRQLSSSQFIVKFYGICRHKENLLICMELMDFSFYDLYRLAHAKSSFFSEKLLGFIVVSMVNALVYCREMKVMHRDLKPANILGNLKGRIKLADFGESRIIENSMASTFVGTVLYWPPERFLDPASYDSRSDVWGLGITLSEIAFGKNPFYEDFDESLNDEFNNKDIFTVKNRILATETNELVNKCFSFKYSEELRSFAKACISEVEQRKRFDELREDAFYLRYQTMLEQKNGEEMAANIIREYMNEE